MSNYALVGRDITGCPTMIAGGCVTRYGSGDDAASSTPLFLQPFPVEWRAGFPVVMPVGDVDEWCRSALSEVSEAQAENARRVDVERGMHDQMAAVCLERDTAHRESVGLRARAREAEARADRYRAALERIAAADAENAWSCREARLIESARAVLAEGEFDLVDAAKMAQADVAPAAAAIAASNERRRVTAPPVDGGPLAVGGVVPAASDPRYDRIVSRVASELRHHEQAPLGPDAAAAVAVAVVHGELWKPSTTETATGVDLKRLDELLDLALQEHRRGTVGHMLGHVIRARQLIAAVSSESEGTDVR